MGGGTFIRRRPCETKDFHRPQDTARVLQVDHLPGRRIGVDEFVRILTEPDASLTAQYQALLATEGLEVTFTEEGLRRIAEIAWQVNKKTENIGARRLHTVMERLLEEASFGAADAGLQRQPLRVDADYVNRQLQDLSADEDLSRFIL